MANQRFKLPGMAALSALEAAARLGSFTRAADELNTSQPAISRHVRDLEERLGTTLFQRKSGGLSLTESGTRLYRAVQSGLGEIADSISEIREKERQRKRTVSIACSYDNAHLLVMPRYGALSDVLGSAGLRVLATEFEHIADLRDEDIDLAIAGGAPPHLRDSFELLFEERLRPVAAPSLWERLGTPSTPEALLNAPLLELDKPNFGWMDWRSWFQRVAPDLDPPTPVRRYPNYVYALEAAAAGEGVALGWEGYCDGYLSTGRLDWAKIPALTTGGGCYAAPSQESPVAPLVTKLIQELKKIGPP